MEDSGEDDAVLLYCLRCDAAEAIDSSATTAMVTEETNLTETTTPMPEETATTTAELELPECPSKMPASTGDACMVSWQIEVFSHYSHSARSTHMH